MSAQSPSRCRMPAVYKLIKFRASDASVALIDHAARVAGKSRAEFILDAASEEARKVLADQVHFKLTPEQIKRFNEVLEAPLRDPDALRRLLDAPSSWMC